MKPIQKNLVFTNFLISLFFLAIFMGKSQTSDNLDSLLLELRKPHHDTIKFEILTEIASLYYFNDFETAKSYFIKAKDIAEKNLLTPNQELENKYLQLKATAIRQIAYIYLNQGDPITASQMYFEALEIGESINCNTTLYNCYNSIAIINHLRNDYEVALQYYYKAIEITEKTGDIAGKSRLLNNLGVLNYDLGNASDSIPERLNFFQNAIEMYTNSLKIRKELDDFRGQMLSYNNLGNVTSEAARFLADESAIRAKLIEAIHYYRQSLQTAIKIKDMITLSKIYGNIADVYLMFYEFKEISNSERKTYSDSIVHYITESYRIAEELNSLPQINDVAFMAKNMLKSIGLIDKAFDYSEIYIKTSSELYSEDKTRSLDEMRIKFETEKKENEIELQQLTIQKTRFQLLMVYLIAGTFVIIGFVLAYVLRQKHRAEKLLAIKNAQLQTSNATKDKFFSIISHDLRTPVSGFRNLTTLIGEKFEMLTPDQVRESISNLNHAADETITMLNNLLHWARSQQNIIKVKPCLTNTKLLCSKVFDELSVKLKEKGITINAQGVGAFEVNLDENIVSTILRNLLSNAIKFSPANSSIQVDASIANSNLHISVKDNGIGMIDEDQSKLFRIECDTKSIGKSPEKGTGLGLIICKELVTLHGGTIEVESKPDYGSAFTFIIPIKQKDGQV